jgi:Transglycosylase
MKALALTTHPGNRHGWQRRWRVVLGVILVPLFLLLAAWLALPLVPLPTGLSAVPEPSVELLDRNGRPLRQARAVEGQFHRTITYAELPQSLIDATLAAEDKRFWHHHGVDWRATFRALWQNARHGRVISGGSTLTQQLIKLAGGRPRTWSSKFIEAAQALRLEQVWDKQRILAAYLNRIDYGGLNGTFLRETIARSKRGGGSLPRGLAPSTFAAESAPALRESEETSGMDSRADGDHRGIEVGGACPCRERVVASRAARTNLSRPAFRGLAPSPNQRRTGFQPVRV